MRSELAINLSNYHRKSLFNYKNILTILVIVNLMSFWFLLKSNNLSLYDFYILYNYGIDVGNFSPFSYLEFIVINFTPIYLLSLFLENEAINRSYFTNIRIFKSSNWIKSLLNNSIKFILVYVLLSSILPIFIAYANGLKSINLYLINKIIIVLILKFLELILQFLLMFYLYCKIKNITFAFTSLLVINMLNFLPYNIIYFIPFGVSSLCRYIDFNFNINFSILSSLIFISILYTKIKHKSYKQLLSD